MDLVSKLKNYVKANPWIYKFVTFRLGKIEIKGKNNTVINKSLSLKDSNIVIHGNRNFCEIEPGVVLENVSILIKGNNHKLKFGSNVRIAEGASIRLLDESNTLIINNYTTIQSVKIVMNDNNCTIDIGRDCLFSSDITMRTSDGHSILDSAGNRINKASSIFIGNHVWVGNNVNILKGVRIGDNVVVGTCAVVTRDIENNCLAVGAPAKVIKHDINWSRERL